MFRPDETVYWLPGILSKGEGLQVLGGNPTGDVVRYDPYGTKRFDARRIVDRIAGEILWDLRDDGYKALLVGASLGGMLAPFVVREMRRRLDSSELGVLSNLRIVIIDAPSGATSMKAVSPLASRVIASPFGHLLRPLAHIKVLPKEEYIQVPDVSTMFEIADRAMSDAEWHAYVKQRAKQELSGHSSKLWLEQLRWMIRVGADGSLAEACKALDGVNTAHLQCTGPANDVLTVDASTWWYDSVPGLKTFWVEAAHCGFLQQAPAFRKILAKILG